jgi:Fe-S cluster assembly protein SufD
MLPVPDENLNPLDDDPGGKIVLLPGGVKKTISEEIQDLGVIFEDFATTIEDHPDIFQNALNKIVKPEDGKFAALAAALGENGIFVYIPSGVQVIKPLQSIMWAAGSGLTHISHLLIWLGDEASLTYIHENVSPNEMKPALHSGIVEIHVGRGANLKFVELQSLGSHFWNFSHERAKVHRDGQLDWIFGAVGSLLTKNFTDLDLVGPGASSRMSGFYFSDGKQHFDHDTQQNHYSPHTTSDLLFKGALKDNSRSVWQGMIYVAPEAQQTDGYQANRNLILSQDARADSIPGLEILADDVRCTHGATVGRIDPDQLFYLRARGIPNDKAERLVVDGFFEPIMDRIPFDRVKSRFKQVIKSKMGIIGG